MQVCLQFSSLCSLIEREGCGSDSQEQGSTQVSAGTMVFLLVTWDVSVGFYPALSCLILLAVGRELRMVAVPCFGHVRCIGDSWVQVILKGWCVPGVWRQSLQHLCGVLHPLRWVRMLGVFCGGCVFDFSGVFHFVTWQGRDSGQLTSHLGVSSDRALVAGCIPFPVPWGLCFWDNPSLHLPLLLVLSCFEITSGFEEACFGWRFDKLIDEMVCFCFTPSCAKSGAGPRL